VPQATYTLTDGSSGDTSTLDITVTPVDDPPVLKSATDSTVSEEGFAFGNKDNLPVPDDNSDSLTDTSGSIVITDPDTDWTTTGNFAAITLGTSANLQTTDGTAVNFAWDTTAHALIGTRSDDNTEVIRITLNSATATATPGDYEIAYSVALSTAMKHLLSGEDEFTFNLDLSLGTTTFSDAFSVAIEDDSPMIQSIQNGVVDNEANLSITGNILASPGADGIAAYQLDPATISEPSVLDYIYANNNTQLLAKDGLGEDLFLLQVNADGTYDFTLYKAAPEALAITPPFDAVDIPNHTDSHTIDLYSDYDADGNAIGDSVGTVTFRVEDPSTQDLSVSQDGLGINNNLMNVGEKMFMDFDSAVSDATFEIGNFSTGDTLTWRVYNENGIQIDSGTINNSFFDTDGNVVNLSSSEAPNYSINLSANGLVAPDGFYSMSLEATTNSYKFTGFSVEKALTVEDQNYDFSVVAIDGDGDVSANAGFTVTVDGTGSTLTGSATSDVINGGFGDDFLVGGDGDDLLIGGIGNDNLTGGSGADIFAYSALGGEGDDTITDFSLTEGDVLRLYDVLDDGSGTLDADDVNVTVNVSGDDVELTINSTTTVTMTGVNNELGLNDGAHSLGDLIDNGMNVQFDPNSHSV
ncbi:MAG: calcium-binding protein, partial [Desulfuromonadales bacterium]